MVYSKDLMILRDGQVVSGKVLKNEFKIKTSFGDVTVNKDDIVHIHLMHQDGTGFPATDEIKTKAGDDIKGHLVKTMTISFVLAANNQTERVHRDKIHTLLFLDSLDTDSEGYPKFSSET
ncbi:MAG: hypothetical protein CO187_08085 [Zetaproteobacteria bacterium CG_4_9_14_3_um_filter_53_7]|nr:MAG: hypothetical protein CO187_08085 [Zetaproteobacteria bacterium CG_4_9_14_3_um_filter_53_7]